MRAEAAARPALILCVTAAALALGVVMAGWLLVPDPPPAPAAPGDPAASVGGDASEPNPLDVTLQNRGESVGRGAPPFVVEAPAGMSFDEEPPLLEPLVAAGELPPLAERLPEEPLVLEGVEGVPGAYGGTLLWAATSTADVGIISSRLSYASPVRWSASGNPIVPHVAKSLEPTEGGRVWTFTLRRGHRWSDGAPLTSADVAFWWNAIVLEEALGGGRAPCWMLNRGRPLTLEVVSDTVFRFRFEHPNHLFRETVATSGRFMFDAPRHDLEPFHPRLGDPGFLQEQLRAFGLPSPRALFVHVRSDVNPECPRLWPWVDRSFRGSPPQVFVRNPYDFAVDTAGRQLPCVDRVQFDLRREERIPVDAASGRLSMQTRHLRFDEWSEYATRAAEGTIDLRAWINANAGCGVPQPQPPGRAR